MYSNIQSVQIMVALLKKYEVKDIVLAPGGSDIPLIHSIEQDSFFNCYSVVDERSLVYFAIGVAQQKEAKVACICTSGTAVCNFLPGITEAFYQDVPIIAITADKNPYFQDQLETQKINQHNIFGDKVKKMIDLPIINSEMDWWLCERKINEALLAVDHHGTGPVHINIPIIGPTSIYDCSSLPNVRKIDRVDGCKIVEWKRCQDILEKKNKIMVIVGQNVIFTKDMIESMNTFFNKYNCIYAVENISNLECQGMIYTYPLSEMLSTTCGDSIFKNLNPDLIISLGNNLAAYDMKTRLRKIYKSCEHWLISEKGEVRDEYKCLTKIFECNPFVFFDKIVSLDDTDSINGKEYFELWNSYLNQVDFGHIEYSSLYVAKRLSEIIPEKSIVHSAILNSTRVMQLFRMRKNIKMYSNVGGLGIDGCLSTFMGQASVTEELAFLLIGDLSFFYDMNAAGIRERNRNIRIIMINNGGGEEFHFFMGKKNIPTINNYIAVKHSKSAAGWIKSLGYDYYSVNSCSDFEQVETILGKKSDKPIFVEVFLDMEKDSEYLRSKYNEFNDKMLPYHISIVKKIASGFSDKRVEQVRKILKI